MTREDERPLLDRIYGWIKTNHLQELRRATGSVIPIGTAPSYQLVSEKNRFPVYASFPAADGRPFCIEYKLGGVEERERVQALLNQVAVPLERQATPLSIEYQIKDTQDKKTAIVLGQQLTWQPTGKRGGHSPIIALYYRNRDEEYALCTEFEWFTVTYIAFLEFVEWVN